MRKSIEFSNTVGKSSFMKNLHSTQLSQRQKAGAVTNPPSRWIHSLGPKEHNSSHPCGRMNARLTLHNREVGGFRYIFETFTDLLTSQKANDIASEFVRNKIRAIVKDEETAEALCPDYSLMAKRPPLGHFYYETFNKPHVKLVDVKKNPIDEITEKGVRIGTDEYEVDTIIYAIGFDAGTGGLAAMDVRGRDNRDLNEEWSKNLETFLGICVEGYPNMFMISAPQSPFANLPVVLDGAADWVRTLMAKYLPKR